MIFRYSQKQNGKKIESNNNDINPSHNDDSSDNDNRVNSYISITNVTNKNHMTSKGGAR